ncbi:MAG: Ig-like domain-containing protein, partial [Coriobacteriia bacterium]|nr:Ig-like domain-containing protein [Coriobacteriia bacterium]
MEPYSAGNWGHIYMREFRNLNTPLVAVADAYTTAEDAPFVVAAPGVLANDTDVDGDSLEATLVVGPAHG